MDPMHLLDLPVAARPFLPAGRGGLILILGGLNMVVVALLLLLASSPSRAPAPVGMSGARRRQVAPRPRGGPAGGGARRSAPSMDERTRRLVQGAMHRQIGSPHVLVAARDRCTLRLHGCRGCESRGAAHGCARERTALQEIGYGIAPGTRVREFACRGRGDDGCWFEVTWGGRP